MRVLDFSGRESGHLALPPQPPWNLAADSGGRVSLSRFFGLTGLLRVGVVGGLRFRSAEARPRPLPSGLRMWLGRLAE